MIHFYFIFRIHSLLDFQTNKLSIKRLTIRMRRKIVSVKASLHPHRPARVDHDAQSWSNSHLESENDRKKRKKGGGLSQWPLRRDRDSIQWLRPELVRQWVGPIRIRPRERGPERASSYPAHARRSPRKNRRPTSPSADLYVECSLSGYVSANDGGHRRLSGGNFVQGKRPRTRNTISTCVVL